MGRVVEWFDAGTRDGRQVNNREAGRAIKDSDQGVSLFYSLDEARECNFG